MNDECENCNQKLKPKKDDCGVYYSYGTIKYPSIQLKTNDIL